MNIWVTNFIFLPFFRLLIFHDKDNKNSFEVTPISYNNIEIKYIFRNRASSVSSKNTIYSLHVSYTVYIICCVCICAHASPPAAFDKGMNQIWFVFCLRINHFIILFFCHGRKQTHNEFYADEWIKKNFLPLYYISLYTYTIDSIWP